MLCLILTLLDIYSGTLGGAGGPAPGSGGGGSTGGGGTDIRVAQY